MPTTTTTIPPVRQPAAVTLPPLPENGIGWGSSGPVTLAYEQRLKALHFDPGPVDGAYSQDTNYAVVAVEKLYGQPRDGVIGPNVKFVLEHFKYKAAKPKAEGDRVEIDLDTQVLTVYKHWQPILHHHDVDRKRRALLRRRRRLPVRDHAGRQVPLLLPAQGLGQRQARQDVEPVLLQRRHRRARPGIGAVVPGVARVRAHPDRHRQLLPDARDEG